MANYTIDAQHSMVEFSVRHMGVSNVKGRFLDFEGQIHIDETTPTASWVRVTIRAASVDTGAAERDAHLRNNDFLSVSLFPQIVFRSTEIVKIDNEHWSLTGNLTVRGITRAVSLDATVEGRMVDVQGVERLGFSAACSIDRRHFGVNWNGWMGRYLVGDEVKIAIDLEAWRRTSTGSPPDLSSLTELA